MRRNLLNSLAMTKYERLMPRIFPSAARIEVRERKGELVWQQSGGSENHNEPDVAWSDFGRGIERRQSPEKEIQFRAPIRCRKLGRLGWLVVGYDTRFSVPVSTAPESLRRAFVDAVAFLQEEIELQSECNQLAEELTERYEELNLVYNTHDQVDNLSDGHEALTRLVHNCADYLDVGLAALVCRDRNILLHSASTTHPPADTDEILRLLEASVYDRVESQVGPVILNKPDEEERSAVFGDRPENLLAYPVIDDHGNAMGLLAVVARRSKLEFSNGDRNLLEVMAKKATRIIHTHHDSLTGLMNRSGFEPSLVAALAGARNKNQVHCLMHIDIDQLHVINDLMGYQEGDALIRRVARSLRGALRDSDLLARLGGDEFAVLLYNCGIEQAQAIAEKIRLTIRELTVISANRQLDVTASVGAAAIGPDSEGIVGIMAAAEIACKAAKEGGRDRVQIYQEDNTSLVRRSEEIEWLGRVQQGLRDDLFCLHCQPVMPLGNPGDAPHFEILIRLQGDDGKLLEPGLFIPAAERYQLMPQIDRWVIRSTLKALSETWKSIEGTDAVFCINLSGQSLTNPGFQTYVTDEVRASKVPADRICFEITETAAISNIDDAVEFMSALREMGCLFSLDDFGAGLSSFGYLKVLPVDYLKIDGSFVREITTDKVSLSMVSAICQIGRTMGLTTVAEFVGDEATVRVLKKLGADYGQGYHIGKPMPLADILDRLQRKSSVTAAQQSSA